MTQEEIKYIMDDKLEAYHGCVTDKDEASRVIYAYHLRSQIELLNKQIEVIKSRKVSTNGLNTYTAAFNDGLDATIYVIQEKRNSLEAKLEYLNQQS